MTPESVQVIEREARNVLAFIETVAEAASLETGDRKADFVDALRAAVAPRHYAPPKEAGVDHRATLWRFRVRIYGWQDNFADPIADSDADLEAGDPGTLETRGLRLVADMAVRMATEFHADGPLSGLDADTLDRKVKGLRPTLSRRGGNAVWRLHYNTQRSIKPGAPGDMAYLLRIDLERIDEGQTHRGPPRQTTPTHAAPAPAERRLPTPGTAIRSR